MGQGSVVRRALIEQHHQGMVARLLNNTALARLEHRAAHAVFPKLDPVIPSPKRPDRQPGPGRHHQRSAGETHRADRGNDDGIDAGMKNRPPCRQGVPGGARGGGEDQATTTHLIDYFPIDLELQGAGGRNLICLLYTSPSPRDVEESRMPSSA